MKLDGAIVRDMEQNPRSREIIAGIAKMSETLHYDLIAEYVETKSQRAMLDSLGCHIYQGYLYAPALDLPRLELYLMEQGIIDKMAPERHDSSQLYL